MIIIEKPYVSEFLVDSIVKNDWAVLDNDAVLLAGIEEGALETIPSDVAKSYYSTVDYPLIYSNSENAVNWVLENIPDSQLSSYIKLFKDKSAFRNMLKEIFPNYQYREVEYGELKKIKLEELTFPLVLKPAVGFLSLGVHTISSDKEWKQVLFGLESEMKEVAKLYPDTVINSSKFLIEEYIQGEEYAVDAYFDKNGMPVILNIFYHPFLDEKDVKDRIYIVSAGIMIKYMAKFMMLLKSIGDKNDIRNFAMHLELRVTEDGQIIPIEINPMRFAGWCTTDLAKYVWGINVYECFMKQQKPDWNAILSNASNKKYYFSMAEVPIGTSRDKIKSFDYGKYLANFSNVLELRKIDFRRHPLFAVIFGCTEDDDEIRNILELKTKDYTIFS